MVFYSTLSKQTSVSLRQAVLEGLARDGSLYMPAGLKAFDKNTLAGFAKLSFPEICFRVASQILSTEIDSSVLQSIIEQAINFDAPLVRLTDEIYSLELYHGPTLAFKDFGARFMAGLLRHFTKDEKRKTVILVATSGDTGGAVADSFHGSDSIDVVILYPSGKVSLIQEKQLTTLGENIHALEVKGNFDDCQRMVKQAFLDKELSSQLTLSSANSINIARLIPQSFYYFYAWSRLEDSAANKPLVFSVPSGNFGNLSGAILASKLGLPVHKLIAATNANDTIPRFLKTGRYEPRSSVATVSNAMDVGAPNNFPRMQDLFFDKLECFNQLLKGYSFSDEETLAAITALYRDFSYVADPHGAVAYLGLKSFIHETSQPISGIFLETAHPAKFLEAVQPQITGKVNMPERLAITIKKNKNSTMIRNDFEDLKSYLLGRYF